MDSWVHFSGLAAANGLVFRGGLQIPGVLLRAGREVNFINEGPSSAGARMSEVFLRTIFQCLFSL